jgi:hypothetical protein
MGRLRIAAFAAAATVLLAGCGGPSDQEKIKATVRDYFTAFAGSDWNAACGDLTADARAKLQKAAMTPTCQAAFMKAVKQPDVARFQPKFRDAKVSNIDVNGNAATVKVSALGVSTKVPLVKEGDNWKIEGPAGAGG